MIIQNFTKIKLATFSVVCLSWFFKLKEFNWSRSFCQDLIGNFKSLVGQNYGCIAAATDEHNFKKSQKIKELTSATATVYKMAILETILFSKVEKIV